MKSPYTYITIEHKPQLLDLILDDRSPTCKEQDRETKLAYSAPDLKAALLEIHRIATDMSKAPNGASYNRNLLLLIEIKANNALKPLK